MAETTQKSSGKASRYPKSRTVAFLVVPALAALLLTAAGTHWVLMPAVKDILVRQKKDALSKLTASAIGILKHHYELVEAGRMEEEQAKKHAASEIRKLRYGLGLKNYFWIIDTNYTCIVNPYAPRLEGRNIRELRDKTGYPFIERFVDVARGSGQGYVSYFWQWKDEPARIEKKVSHLRLFEPWEWIVGTGMYFADVEKDLSMVSSRLMRVFSGVFLILVLLLLGMSAQAMTLERRRQAALEELEAANEELKKLDQVKDGLIRAVSHELKTPLAKQAMQLEMLKQIAAEKDCQDESGRIFGVMETTLKRLEATVSNLLELSRLEEGGRKYSRQPARLDMLVDNVLEDYSYALEMHGFKVEKDLRPVELETDSEMLWHVISNLINNAIKFRKSSGPNLIRLSLKKEDDRVVLSVSDNGIGMGPEELEKAFDKFYQATASIEGTGVGLNICKKIVEDLGGSIWMESQGKGEGVTVRVSFPVEGQA